MKLTEFVEGGANRWERLDALVSAGGRRPESLGSERLAQLVDLYRATASDLALARRLFPSDPVVARLEQSVIKARGALHDRASARRGVVDFFRVGYWEIIADRSRPMMLSAAFLVIPALLGALWVAIDPETVTSLMPPDFLWVTEVASTDVGYSASDLIGFSTYVMSNNIRVTFVAFVGGLTWGLLSAFSAANNGLILGALAALAYRAGNTKVLIEAIAAHGVLELSCIVVGCGAGLSMGRAMLRPGISSRVDSLAHEAQALGLMVLGTVPWLVLAGIIEGFVSRTGTTWPVSLAIGVPIGAGFWFQVWRHRPSRSESLPRPQSLALRLARR